MKWSVRGIAVETVERAKALGGTYGSVGEVLNEAVRRLYESEPVSEEEAQDEGATGALDDDMRKRFVQLLRDTDQVLLCLGDYLGVRSA